MNGQRPLDGVRVLDLTVVWAGTFGTMMLGDLGAEVIKPENPFVLQPLTRLLQRNVTRQFIDNAVPWTGGFPHNEPGPRPWNYWANSISLYRNKKSFTVDFRRPEGMDILRRLVQACDVVCENNAAGTLEKLGITYDWLKAANDRIIYVRLPAFGLDGPYANARALGLQMEAAIGHSLLRGYDDMYPGANTGVFAGDYMAGATEAFAVMAALLEREQSGKGQLVEVPLSECSLPMLAQAVMDYSLNEHVQGTVGNRDVHGRAPCGVYPARSPGTADDGGDRWIALHVETEAQWQSLLGLMFNPGLASDPRFETNTDRMTHHQELDALIAAWTAQHDDYQLMHLLQGCGIPAAPVLEASRVLDDPQLRARHFWKPLPIENGETYDFIGPLWQFSETPVPFEAGPTAIGEYNDYVYREVLRVDDDEYNRLKTAGHITMDLDDSVP